jgi:hypothetical protein
MKYILKCNNGQGASTVDYFLTFHRLSEAVQGLKFYQFEDSRNNTLWGPVSLW